MKVTVKTIDSQSIVLEAEPSLLVSELKTLILDKLGESGDKQIRLIWRGKVLKDEKKLSDYCTEGLMLHLVYKAPPRAEPQATAEPSREDTPPAHPLQQGHGVVMFHSLPSELEANISQITQGLVDHVLGRLSAQGAQGHVTATASRLDSSGRTETASASASTGDAPPTTTPPNLPPTQSQDSPPVDAPPTATPTNLAPTQSQNSTPMQETPPAAREEEPRAKPNPPERSNEEDERRRAVQEYRTQRLIRNHIKNSYKCFQQAEKVLMRLQRAEEGSVESALSSLPVVEELLERDSGTTPVGIYHSLLEYQEVLNTRARPVIREMCDCLRADTPVGEEKRAWHEAQVAQTVRDFNYYMGHGSVSLSRLHVNMFAPPPREIQSTAPKVTEMRGLMAQMRARHMQAQSTQQHQEGEYAIEIRHKDQQGRERVTKARVNPGSRGGALFGMMGGAGGGASEPMETDQPPRPAPGSGVTISAMNSLVDGSAESGELENGELEDAIPEYLARLIAHMVAGVAMEPRNRPEDGELTFARRFAGPPGTKVTIRQPSQAPMFPGMGPETGASITVENPLDGTEPQLRVNFPMPPALQLLRNILTRDGSNDQSSASSEQDDKSEGNKDESGIAGPSQSAASDPSSPRHKPGEEPRKSELWKDDDLDSLSDAGSLDSVGSDHEIPPLVAPLPPGREAMMDAFTQLRHRYGPDQEEGGELGMVEQLLQDISKGLSVLEVMSVFNGDPAPLAKLQPLLLEFIRERLLAGEIPSLDEKVESLAVREFVRGCLPALSAIEDQLPLRDPGIDFPETVCALFSAQFKAAYRIIVRKYNDGESPFSALLAYWAKSSGALFAQVIRHCIGGDQYFEDIVKMLVNTLFPPTTPPLILNMCNSTIHKQLARVQGRPTKSPLTLDSHLVWKQGARPTPNTSYESRHFLADQSEYNSEMPVAFAQNSSPEGFVATPTGPQPPPAVVPSDWEAAAKKDRRDLGHRKTLPLSDAYMAGMPAKKRKLDVSSPHTLQPRDLAENLLDSTAQGTSCEGEVSGLIDSTPGLLTALQDDLHRGISRRLSADPDFNRAKYPMASKWFGVTSRPE